MIHSQPVVTSVWRMLLLLKLEANKRLKWRRTSSLSLSNKSEVCAELCLDGIYTHKGRLLQINKKNATVPPPVII